MIIHDISINIEEDMIYWWEGKKPEMRSVFKISEGAPSEVTRWLLGSHTGTHIDAPRHFIEDGDTVEKLPLDIFVGPARVVDATTADDAQIDAAMVEKANLNGATRVLFKTSNSTKLLTQKDYKPDFVGITADGAQALVDAGVKFVATDYVTVEAPDQCKEWPTHHILCGNGVIILENADLAKIEDGEYFLCCLPIKLKGSEGAPARTVLIEGIECK
ncbi:cyclase family protein [Hyphococcus sp.]|uniref:cyclase family protein n=1 Tax=Hyphococcus sp. TaxID=2038636 RepID=UPI003CCBD53E